MTPDIETARETAALMGQIAESKEAYDDLPGNDQLQVTVELPQSIEEGKEAYDELPDNDQLQDTVNILGSLMAGKEAYDELPSDDELDATKKKEARCCVWPFPRRASPIGSRPLRISGRSVMVTGLGNLTALARSRRMHS